MFGPHDLAAEIELGRLGPLYVYARITKISGNISLHYINYISYMYIVASGLVKSLLYGFH